MTAASFQLYSFWLWTTTILPWCLVTQSYRDIFTVLYGKTLHIHSWKSVYLVLLCKIGSCVLWKIRTLKFTIQPCDPGGVKTLIRSARIYWTGVSAIFFVSVKGKPSKKDPKTNFGRFMIYSITVYRSEELLVDLFASYADFKELECGLAQSIARRIVVRHGRVRILSLPSQCLSHWTKSNKDK